MLQSTKSGKHCEASTDAVIFLPDWSKGNPYQNLLKASLLKQQVKVELKNFPKGLFSLTQLVRANPTATVLHIHWINNLVKHILWSPNCFIQYIKLLFLALDIIYVRYRGTKVVWTIHNLVSHESPNRKLEIKARRIIAKTCSNLIIHSVSALNMVEQAYSINLKEKVSVIPHGNYDGCYVFREKRALEFKKAWQLEDDNIVMLFFGAIRPYKGVEKLLESFVAVPNFKLRLVIAGNPEDGEFSKSIINAAKHDSRITLLLHFIPDDDVAALFSIADVVVLPFDRTLTSGSVVLALTMGKALLLPEEARVFDMVDEYSCIFFDSTSSLQALISSLDKTQLSRMGEASRCIADGLNWLSIAERTAATYRK